MSLEKELNAVTENVRQHAPAEVFSVMASDTEKLAASGISERALKPGQRMPSFSLPDATGKTVTSAELLANGPVVISFYRGNWCPYCNLELRALQAQLADIEAAGATLVAISPELPDQSLSTQEKHDLKFPVLSDIGNAVARQFGLVFELDASVRPIYAAFGVDLQSHNGDGSFELPLPATYVVDRDGTVLNRFVNANYRERLEPATLLSWLNNTETA